MKKSIYLLLICCLFIANIMGCNKGAESKAAKNLTVSTVSNEANNNQITSPENTYTASKQSQQELYQDIFNTLFIPYIQKAIDNYYEKYLTISPTYTPEYVKILSIERPRGYRTFSFLIKLQIVSFVGPHIDIGVDQLTISVSGGDGEVKVEKFEHIKSYFDELPSNYKDIVKNKTN